MKKRVLGFLFSIILATGAFAAAAAGLLIHIDVISSDNILVEGKSVTVATLSSTVGALVTDREHTAVELKFPAKLEQAKVEEIKAACRKAGISLFSISTKP